MSERRAAYQEFFQSLIDALRDKHQLTNQRVAQPQNWAHFSAGVAGIRYGVTFSLNGLRAEVYIDVDDGRLNRAIYDTLAGQRAAIEQEAALELVWEPLETRKACRISVYRPAEPLADADRAELLGWTVEMLLKLRAAFGPRLRPALAEAERLVLGEVAATADAAA